MDQTDRHWFRWTVIALFLLMSLLIAAFLSFWYAVWPMTPRFVVIHSPWIIPQVRALGKTNIQDGIWEEGKNRFRQIVQVPNSGAQSALISCLRTSEPNVRWAALQLVPIAIQHDVMSPDLISEILRVTKDVDRGLREAALAKMGYLPRAQAEVLAITAFDSGDQDVQFIAVLSMSKAGNRVLIPRLIDWLHDSQPQVRARALFLLYLTRDVDAMPAILPFLYDRDPDIALWAGKFMTAMSESQEPSRE